MRSCRNIKKHQWPESGDKANLDHTNGGELNQVVAYNVGCSPYHSCCPCANFVWQILWSLFSHQAQLLILSLLVIIQKFAEASLLVCTVSPAYITADSAAQPWPVRSISERLKGFEILPEDIALSIWPFMFSKRKGRWKLKLLRTGGSKSAKGLVGEQRRMCGHQRRWGQTFCCFRSVTPLSAQRPSLICKSLSPKKKARVTWKRNTLGVQWRL